MTTRTNMMAVELETVSISMYLLIQNTSVGAAAALAIATDTVNNALTKQWSEATAAALGPMPIDLDLSPLNALQEQTSRLLDASYDTIAQQTRRIRNQIEAVAADNAFEYEYLKNAMDSATATVLANASPQQWQIVNDAVSMLGANYAYDAAQREIDLHRDCIAAAYDDLSNAARIVIDGSTSTRDLSSDWQRLRQVQEHVLSAVQHLQDSCPLCRALKYAANDANQNLLPFVTVLCSSILKTLHPFVADPSSS